MPMRFPPSLSQPIVASESLVSDTSGDRVVAPETAFSAMMELPVFEAIVE
jgi:hypothetical protein